MPYTYGHNVTGCLPEEQPTATYSVQRYHSHLAGGDDSVRVAEVRGETA